MIKKFTIASLLLLLALLFPNHSSLAVLSDTMAGRILLQVEENGEAWYVSPDKSLRYYLGRPADAWALMRAQGLGITDANLERIAPATAYLSGADADHDGLPDKFEEAIGTDKNKPDTDQDGFNDKNEIERNYDPNSQSLLPINNSLASSLKGRILLQVEAKGEAWYVNPEDNKRYFLGSPTDAFNVMRNLGIGISNSDLSTIKTYTPNYDIKTLEIKIFDLINEQRQTQGLTSLKLNNDLAAVAREHSSNLAKENAKFTGLGMTCNFPIIHHEGFDFGTYHDDRLNSRDIYYFSRSAENIALMNAPLFKYTYAADDGIIEQVEECRTKYEIWEKDIKARIEATADEEERLKFLKEEIVRRTDAYQAAQKLNLVEMNWKAVDKISQETVTGWMNSAGHRKNILTADYDETGIGTAYVNGSIITTQIFIKRAACGFKTGACCEKEGYYPYCYIPWQCDMDICK